LGFNDFGIRGFELGSFSCLLNKISKSLNLYISKSEISNFIYLKSCFLILLLFLAQLSFGQKTASLNSIDWKVQFIDAPTTDSLAKKLTEGYTTDLEKVRAIFSWVANKISYNTGIFRGSYSGVKFVPEPENTTSEWKSADEMVAERVLKRRVAVCDGYARLFKTLCQYAGLKCELILGYVNPQSGRIDDRFRTNHTWNAVMIDEEWKLLDVTWASGYMTYSNEFVHQFDEYYFLTPPYQMIRDHFPEDPQWTLLINPPALGEFKRTPFKGKAFAKYGIRSLTPGHGTIEASVGDTVFIEVELQDVSKAKKIASSNYNDSLAAPLPGYAMIEPAVEKGNRVLYNYVVQSPFVNWLQLLYNKDMILQYRINVKESLASRGQSVLNGQ
jgi:hypothetical protein